jgi:pimeloyl-ACP methyl ester carboxylesterase
MPQVTARPAGTAPAQFAAPWGGRGLVTELDDGPVHWVDFGGPAATAAPPLVLVHGLGGSHLNWVQVAPALAADRRVLAVDLAGFGLTPAGGRAASVTASAGLLGRFVRQVAGAPAVLAGNSMGGMVAALAAHADPAAVAGLVLVDASLPVQAPAAPGGPRADPWLLRDLACYATPGLGEFWLWAELWRTTPRQQVTRLLDLCFADPGRADPAVTEASVALAALRRAVPGAGQAFLQAARSLTWLLAQPGRYRAVLAGLTMPVLLIHGEQDRLVPAGVARAAAAAQPAWSTAFLPGIGHTPQLEAPGPVIAAIRSWAGCDDRQAGPEGHEEETGDDEQPDRVGVS